MNVYSFHVQVSRNIFSPRANHVSQIRRYYQYPFYTPGWRETIPSPWMVTGNSEGVGVSKAKIYKVSVNNDGSVFSKFYFFALWLDTCKVLTLKLPKKFRKSLKEINVIRCFSVKYRRVFL